MSSQKEIPLVLTEFVPDLDSYLSTLQKNYEKEGYTISKNWEILVKKYNGKEMTLAFTFKHEGANDTLIFSAEKKNEKINVNAFLREKHVFYHLLDMMRKKKNFDLTLSALYCKELIQTRKDLVNILKKSNSTQKTVTKEIEEGLYYIAACNYDAINTAINNFVKNVANKDIWLPGMLRDGEQDDLEIDTPYNFWLEKKEENLIREKKIYFVTLVNVSYLLRQILNEANARGAKVDSFDVPSAIELGLTINTEKSAMQFYIQNIIRSVLFEGHSLDTEIKTKSLIFDKIA